MSPSVDLRYAELSWADAAASRRRCLGSVFNTRWWSTVGWYVAVIIDHERELLTPLILRASTGRPCVEDRQVVNGMVHRVRTGVSWRSLAARYGLWKTVSLPPGPGRRVHPSPGAGPGAGRRGR
ncbi:transposase [Streptomyces peucetius]|uniref:transposase n=1 Tax=Streptomyces peucetius TaxID=1950 RepID=UPI0039B0E3E0